MSNNPLICCHDDRLEPGYAPFDHRPAQQTAPLWRPLSAPLEGLADVGLELGHPGRAWTA
jgi:hypothetical protein